MYNVDREYLVVVLFLKWVEELVIDYKLQKCKYTKVFFKLYIYIYIVYSLIKNKLFFKPHQSSVRFIQCISWLCRWEEIFSPILLVILDKEPKELHRSQKDLSQQLIWATFKITHKERFTLFSLGAACGGFHQTHFFPSEYKR